MKITISGYENEPSVRYAYSAELSDESNEEKVCNEFDALLRCLFDVKVGDEGASRKTLDNWQKAYTAPLDTWVLTARAGAPLEGIRECLCRRTFGTKTEWIARDGLTVVDPPTHWILSSTLPELPND